MRNKSSIILATFMLLTFGGCRNSDDNLSSKTSSINESSLVSSSSSNNNSSVITQTSSNIVSTSTKKTMENVLFDDLEIVFDGEAHTIEASVYPDGSIVTYTNAGPFVNVGTYEIKVLITHPDYYSYEGVAVLVIKEATMNTISFEGKEVTYDGNEYTLEATGYPTDATVTYTNAGPYTEVGTYEIGVRIEKANYKTFEDTKILKINAAQMDESAIVFDDLIVTYDGQEHTLEAKGYPTDATVTYINAGPYTEVGEYEIGVRIEKANYKTITKTAILSIKQAEMPPFIFEDEVIEYDGESHTIEAIDYPEGSIVTYTNAGPYTELGTYDISVTISHNNYKTVTKTVTLTIVEPVQKLKALSYYSYEDNSGVVVTFSDNTYSSAKIYPNTYLSLPRVDVLIDGESLKLTGYRKNDTSPYVTIYATINELGFKITSCTCTSTTNALYTYLSGKKPQFKEYYGTIGFDFSKSQDGEVFEPSNYLEKYYDGSSWNETSGNAVGASHTLTRADGSLKTYQGVDFKVPSKGKEYRYYFYQEEINPNDLMYYEYIFEYINTESLRIFASLIAFDSDGNTYSIIGNTSTSSLAGWYNLAKDTTDGCSHSETLTNGIPSNIEGFYIALKSNETIELSITLLYTAIGVSYYEFIF